MKRLIAVAVVEFTISILALFAQTAQAQSPPGKDSTYSLNLELELLENERETEESNYGDVYQKRAKKKASVDLTFYYLHLDGSYREYNSIVKVDEEESQIDDIKDNLSLWVEIFKYLYIFNQSKNIMYRYEYFSASQSAFQELEKARALMQGIGVKLNDWRMGVAPQAAFTWTYDIEAAGQSILHENIEFDLNVYEIVKRAQEREGLFFEVGLKQWTSSKALRHRNGKLENLDGVLIVGFGFSEDSAVFIGEKASRGKIKSMLKTDNSKFTRTSDAGNFIFGFEVGVGDDSVVYIEKQIHNGKIKLENQSFSNRKSVFEDEVSFGVRLNENLSLELKMAKNIIEEKYTERVITNQTDNFRQTDNLIGASLELLFSD